VLSSIGGFPVTQGLILGSQGGDQYRDVLGIWVGEDDGSNVVLSIGLVGEMGAY